MNGTLDKKRYILLAEDDNDFLPEFIKVWQFFGYEVITAMNGAELTEKANTLIKDNNEFAIIVDNQMPEATGQAQDRFCGFKTIIALCKAYPDLHLGDRVIFLSVWRRKDMPKHLLSEAEDLKLLGDNQWFRRFTAFAVIYDQVKQIFSEA